MSSKLYKLTEVPGTDFVWWLWQYTVARNPNNGKETLQTDYLLKRQARGMRSRVLLNCSLAEVLALRGSIDDMLTVASGIGRPEPASDPEPLPVDAVAEYLKWYGVGSGRIVTPSLVEIMGEFDLSEGQAVEVLRLAWEKFNE